MRKKWLFLLLLPSFFLTGCWDRKDPEDREYIITLGVDPAETGYRFSFASAHPEESESAPYTAESKTLAGAVAQVDCRSSRKTELGQLKTIIFSQALLADGTKCRALLEELEASYAISEKVMLLATEDTALACVEAVLQEDSGLFLWDFYKNTAQQVAVTQAMDLDTFRILWQEQGGCAIFPRISPADARLRLGGGIAVGKKGVYPLQEQTERGYLFLRGEAEGALLEGEGASFRVEKSEVRYAFSADAFDHIRCTIFLSAEGAQTGEAETAYFASLIKEEALHTIKIAEQTGEDILGILPRLRRLAPQLAVGRSREELLAALTFEIQAECHKKAAA